MVASFRELLLILLFAMFTEIKRKQDEKNGSHLIKNNNHSIIKHQYAAGFKKEESLIKSYAGTKDHNITSRNNRHVYE